MIAFQSVCVYTSIDYICLTEAREVSLIVHPSCVHFSIRISLVDLVMDIAYIMIMLGKSSEASCLGALGSGYNLSD